jgi:hypothetical protein
MPGIVIVCFHCILAVEGPCSDIAPTIYHRQSQQHKWNTTDVIPDSYSKLLSNFRDVICCQRDHLPSGLYSRQKAGASLAKHALVLTKPAASEPESARLEWPVVPFAQSIFGLLTKGSGAEQEMRGGAEGRTQTA